MTIEQTTCWICGGDVRPVVAPVPNLVECANCGFWFRPLPPEEVAGHHDDAYFEEYVGGSYLERGAERAYEAGLRLRWLAELGARPPGRLLEVGSAAGQFVAAAVAAGWQARGIEVNDTVARYARDVLGVDVATGLVEAQDLPEAGVDIAVMWHVLEHIPEPLSTVRRLALALKPGGRFAVEVPNIASREARAMGTRWRHLQDPNHVSHYSPDTLALLVERSGLTVESVDTVPFRHYAQNRSTRMLWQLASIRQERALARSPHPAAHPLLRVCARRPDGV